MMISLLFLIELFCVINTHLIFCVIFLRNTLDNCILVGLKKYLEHKLIICLYANFTEKILKSGKIRSLLVWFDYKCKSSTSWFGLVFDKFEPQGLKNPNKSQFY